MVHSGRDLRCSRDDGPLVGKYIMFEGCDGAGSTTQAKLAKDWLFDRVKGHAVLLAAQPSSFTDQGREIRRRIRNDLQDDEKIDQTNDSTYMATLFFHDRKILHQQLFSPLRRAGIDVVCDRGPPSTFAYQTAQGGNMDVFHEAHTLLEKPDLTIFIRAPVPVCLSRIESRGGIREFFERDDFLARVVTNYDTVVERYGDEYNMVVVTDTGSRTREDIHSEVVTHLERLYS